jgi:hypothetical protein
MLMLSTFEFRSDLFREFFQNGVIGLGFGAFAFELIQ